MSVKPKPAPLPDMDDTEFTTKLRSLGDTVIPKAGKQVNRISVNPDRHISGNPDNRTSRLSAAGRIEEIEQTRGPKRRFEYLIPVRVGDALAADAAAKGQSAATRLLEILRDAGYPVKQEDFVDLRKERRR
jgi:hypothetical protein